METLMILLIGVLVSVATYLVLSRNVIRVILGTAVLSHAVHLLILTIGRLYSNKMFSGATALAVTKS